MSVFRFARAATASGMTLGSSRPAKERGRDGGPDDAGRGTLHVGDQLLVQRYDKASDLVTQDRGRVATLPFCTLICTN